ncbi:MAG: LPS export ABC transporter periplasmic protein LptC [Candidatus Bipolaricaulia bacterium]
MSRTRIGLTLAALVALAGGLLWLRPGPPHQRPEGPAIAVLSPTMTKFDETGRRLWELEAEKIILERENDLDRARAEVVRLRFFRNEEVVLEVTAARLFLYSGGELELEGGITAHDDQGLEFRTERARWDPQRGALSGDLEVEITRGEDRLSGRGFEYTPEEGRLAVREAELILVPSGD